MCIIFELTLLYSFGGCNIYMYIVYRIPKTKCISTELTTVYLLNMFRSLCRHGLPLYILYIIIYSTVCTVRIRHIWTMVHVRLTILFSVRSPYVHCVYEIQNDGCPRTAARFARLIINPCRQ